MSDEGYVEVTVWMPEAMHAELRRYARHHGISVTELMRRAVALHKVCFNPERPDQKVILRDGDREREVLG